MKSKIQSHPEFAAVRRYSADHGGKFCLSPGSTCRPLTIYSSPPSGVVSTARRPIPAISPPLCLVHRITTIFILRRVPIPAQAQPVLTPHPMIYPCTVGWDGSTAVPIVLNPQLYPTILNGEKARWVVDISAGGCTCTGWLDPHQWLWCFSQGEGVHSQISHPTIKNCIIQDNRADGDGGGIFLNGGSAQILNNRILNNSANWEVRDYASSTTPRSPCRAIRSAVILPILPTGASTLTVAVGAQQCMSKGIGSSITVGGVWGGRPWR